MRSPHIDSVGNKRNSEVASQEHALDVVHEPPDPTPSAATQ